MTHTFDERGEAAIANLRRDERFNEALYRKLGPVRYWMAVREAEARVNRMKRVSEHPRIDPPQGHNHYIRELREKEDTVSKMGNGLPLEKATRENTKAVNIATSIVLVGAALACVAIVLTVVAICCYGAWSFIF